MAHHKSAEKRNRQSVVRNERNKAYRSRIRTAIKSVRHALESGDLEKAREAYRVMVPIVDRMASRRIIHKNAVARTKSRLNRRIFILANKSE